MRASYLIAADGHRSPIREQLGIARPGPGITQHWLSIVFDADLTGIIERRALFWIVLNPALGFAAFTTTATPGRWAIGISYDPATQSPADFAPERCVEVVRAVVGRDDLPVEVVDVGAWEEAVGVADRYRAGRVFLVGDSAHVWPPAGAMGANSAVQDAHNLAWKLAAVLHGWAGDSLLDSYEAERRPVALELAQLTVQRQAARFGGGQEIDDLDDLNCMLGQRYQSRAIVAPTHDTVFGRQLADEAEPGSRAPHLWIERDGRCISPHDLFSDAFVLLSAEPSWVDAARRLAARMSLPLRAYRVGSASEHADQGERADLVDCSGAWASRYRVGSRGAALIRPDGYVAWLTAGADTNPEAALASALCQVVCRAADYDADADFVAP